MLAAALREVSAEDDAILGGVLVAGADGLVLAEETPDMQVDTVAAIAAVVAGLAGKLIERAGVGESKTCLFEGSSGHVAVFPMKDDMVLAVFSKSEVTTGLFNLAARGVLSRLRKALALETPITELTDDEPPGEPPSTADTLDSAPAQEPAVAEV
jgi:uncharacterized protein